ncbi:two component regulatory system sensor kinase [Burkholderia aenigmatica]|uniref:histidine kinase n=4 Tax=Burkholderia TaxID=32008 RepID=A0ABY6Y7S7_9BURK|nr:two component regulatory system sensor kinase [Burkholderia aenigmatica]VWD47697.1 two component regulatory system sensor kinase [Burkholderia aenigmatica]
MVLWSVFASCVCSALAGVAVWACMRRERLRLEAALRASNDALALAGHELRTPLAAMLALVDVVHREAPAHERRGLLALVHETGLRLMRLLDDILVHARVDAGRLPIAPSAVDPRALLDDVSALFSARAAAKGLRLRVQVAGAVPAWVTMDGERVRQIVSNLVGNAIAFTAHGAVWLRADVVVQARDGVVLEIVVEDTGPGIPDALKPGLFTPFVTHAGAQRDGGAGSGLGLAISRKLARALGGDLRLLDTHRVGAAFALTLRCPVAAQARAGAVYRASATPSDSGAAVAAADSQHDSGGAEVPPRPLCVLIVDDREVNRIALAQQLSRLGHRAIERHGGRAALDLLETGAMPIDVVLTDCRMPGMDGFALAAALRDHRNPRLARMPVIGLSADADIDASGWAGAGMVACLRRPVTPGDLRDVLEGLDPRVSHDADDARGFDATALDYATLFDAFGAAGDGSADARNVLAACRASLDADCAVLSSALHAGDRQALQAWSHAARGTYALFGQPHIDRLLDRFHAALMSGSATAIGNVGAEVLKMTDHLLTHVGERARAAGARRH